MNFVELVQALSGQNWQKIEFHLGWHTGLCQPTITDPGTGSYYLTAKTFGPCVSFRFRISNHSAGPSWEQEVQSDYSDFYLDLGYDARVPSTDEELWALASTQGGPTALQKIERIKEREFDLAKKCRPILEATPERTNVYEVPLAMEALNEAWGSKCPFKLVVVPRWWSGPTGGGVGYYTGHQGRLFRTSFGRGEGAGSYVVIYGAAGPGGVRTARALVDGLDEIKRWRAR